uniref:RPAP1_N domain-containing protein n=1 Tax=Caenorhabditis japonica TaxID=281687 RepID=A0A8R1IAS4_CAEJA
MSDFLKRPTHAETDDDLLQMQQEWERAQQKKTSVEIHRMKNRTKREEREPPKISQSQSKSTRDQAARFQIDLDDIREESNVSDVLFGVQERNIDWLSEEMNDEILRTATSTSEYSKDDGFPEPLDLSAYYSEGTRKLAPPGLSFFAAEFDRIHGNLTENLDEQALKQEEVETSPGDFQAENENYLKSLDTQKIAELRQEIQERFDPKLVEFLANRGKNNAKSEQAPKKVSKFKERRQKELKNQIDKPEEKPEEKSTHNKKDVEEMMNELEVLEEYGNREDQEKYNRLATDAIQLDLTAKFSRNLASRQQKNAVKLFDNCKFPLEGSSRSPDPLIELARSSIEQIKTLYLEEVSLDGHTSYEFGHGVNPILDNCWTLVPVRRVLDAVEKRQGVVTPDDVEIVRLALLWTLLLFTERKSAFFAFAQPNDFYVHLAEVYLIGAEVLADDVVAECAHRVMNLYVLPAARDGKICLRMSGKVAGLDAFMPFYENLLKNYEQYSMGNEHFAAAILIGAYLNSAIGDSIEYRFGLWSPKRNTIRQMTLSASRSLLDAIKLQICEREDVIYEQHYVQYCSLLGAYVTAIRDDLITRDRNPMMFEIAAFEIGKFLEKMQKNPGDSEKNREFQLLVEIVRKSIGNKLSF